jgi:SRSO17 transposase
MDAATIAGLRPRLAQFLSEFDDCFGRREPAAHLRTYIYGQLSDLPRKSIEPIALRFDTPPRTLQQFLSLAHWDEDRMRDRIQQHVAAQHTHRDAVGIFDETSYLKKGTKTPGVKRQYCGTSGKTDNCAVTVHLAYATPDDFRVLLDGELFLPKDWSEDRDRCRAAGIPDPMVHRPKWKIALELLDRAAGNGVHLPWLTFDEGYGLVPEFHAEVDRRRHWYVGEVPCNFHGWCKPPQPLHKKHHRQLGRKAKAKSLPASRVDDLGRHSPTFTGQDWETFYVKEGQKGPIVWQAKFATFHISHQGVPGRPCRLIVARNAVDHNEVKYFVSNAPLNTRHEELLRLGFARYPIERCFEDDKTEVGLDHFEVRNYRSLKRHLILSSLSLLFLAEVHQQDRGEKPGMDGLPGALGGQCDDLVAVDGTPAASGVLAASGRGPELHTEEERRSPQESSQGDAAAASPPWHQDLLPAPLPA